jgi:hypothetical protein
MSNIFTRCFRKSHARMFRRARLFLELLEARTVPSTTPLANGVSGADDDFWINTDWLADHRGTADSAAPDPVDTSANQGDGMDKVKSVTGALDPVINNNNGNTGSSGFTQSETTALAFGNTVVIGYNDSGSNNINSTKFTGFAYSTDGGTTFTDGGELPTNANGDAGDPTLARNNTTGRIYFSTLQFNNAGIDVFYSDNNGVSWSGPTQGAPGKSGGSFSQDKSWITVDNNAGPGNGNVYLVERDFGGGNGIYFFRSTDNGGSFGPNGGTLIASAGSGNVQGAYVTVGNDHSVYVFYLDNSTSTEYIMVRKSTDQGQTFGSAVQVAQLTTTGVNGDLGLVGVRNGTSTASGFRSNAFAQAVVNPVNGNLYVTYADKGTAANDKADIYFKTSSDGGATWSSAVRVNSDSTTTDQWQPTIAVSPDGSRVGVFYYSRQEDTSGDNLFKYYGSVGTVSGSVVTFQTNFAVSDTASPPEFGRDSLVNPSYMGDYDQASATPGYFDVSWADNRSSLPGGGSTQDPNVYFKRIALGLVVTGSTPANGSVVTTNTPGNYVVTFSDPVNSFAASVFTVNGHSATSVALNAAHTQATFTFGTDPVTTQGVQNMAIAAGAITRQSDNGGIIAFNASFRYDAVPLTVTSTSPAVGSVITLGGSSQTLVVTFNDDNAIASGTVANSNLTLSAGTVTGAVLDPGDPNGRTVDYTISGLTTEGTLNVSIAAGALTDSYGNPNVVFSGSYILDFGTVAYPTPLQAVAPFGSLIYDPGASGVINPAGDTDSYTIHVGAGQTITALVTPDANLKPSVLITPPSGSPGSATASAAGKKALLETFATATTGDYTVTVSGANSTTGAYTLQLTLNAALETGNNDGPTNNTLATAENLDSSSITVKTDNTSAQRDAVMGQGDDGGTTTATATIEGFDSKSLSNYTFLSSPSYASVANQAKHDGKYGLQLNPPSNANAEWMYRNDSAVQVGRGDTISVWVMSKGTPTGRAYFGFGATASGTLSMVMGGNTSQLIIQNNSGYGFTDIGAVSQTWKGNNWYLFKISWKSSGDITGQLYDSDGKTLLNTVTAHDDTILSGGIAFRGFGNTLYFDTVQDSKFTPNSDYYSFTAAANDHVTLTLNRLSGSGTLNMALLNSGGTVLKTATTGPTNVSQIIYNYTVTTGGTYDIKVTDLTGLYSVVVARNAVFDAEPNDTFAAAQDMTGNHGALGYLSGSNNTVTLNAADSGWWDQTGAHNSTNKNYITGLYTGVEYRDYLVFDLSSVTQPITGATLMLTNPSNGYSSPDPSETYSLFDVSTAIASLEATGTGQTGIFADLGTGTGYGSRSVSSADNGTVVSVNLNSSALTYLNGAKGGQAAVGGAVTTISGTADQDVFGFTGNSTDVKQLVLNLGPAEDWYKVTLGSTQTTLAIETSTPGDNNTLSPHIQLYNSSDVKLTDGTKLMDGRNEMISATGLTAGTTYYIRIMSEAGTSGAYFLDPPADDAPAIASPSALDAGPGPDLAASDGPVYGGNVSAATAGATAGGFQAVWFAGVNDGPADQVPAGLPIPPAADTGAGLRQDPVADGGRSSRLDPSLAFALTASPSSAALPAVFEGPNEVADRSGADNTPPVAGADTLPAATSGAGLMNAELTQGEPSVVDQLFSGLDGSDLSPNGMN